MSQEPDARTRSGRKTIRKEIAKSGRAKSGKLPEPPSLPQTHGAHRAVISAKCHITPDLKYTENPNTSIYPKPFPIVSDAIEVLIWVDSSAMNVAKLDRNEKVNAAIDALVRRIRNELYFSESTGSENEMHRRENGDNGLKSG